MWKICPDCRGRGYTRNWPSSDSDFPCRTCKTTGKVQVAEKPETAEVGLLLHYGVCPNCGGEMLQAHRDSEPEVPPIWSCMKCDHEQFTRPEMKTVAED